VNFSSDYYNIKILNGHFGDHESLIFKLFFNVPELYQKNQKPNRILKRTQTEHQITEFIKLLKDDKWPMIENYKMNKTDVVSLFNDFYTTYLGLWYYCSPLKLSSCKLKKKKITNWYTVDLANRRKEVVRLL